MSPENIAESQPSTMAENQLSIIDEKNYVEIEGILTRNPEVGKDKMFNLLEFGLVNRRFFSTGKTIPGLTTLFTLMLRPGKIWQIR